MRSPTARRLDENRREIDRGIAGMERAQRDRNQIMLDLHRKDVVALFAESRQLLLDEGIVLRRRLRRIAVAADVLAAVSAILSFRAAGMERVGLLAAAVVSLAVSTAAGIVRRRIGLAEIRLPPRLDP